MFNEQLVWTISASLIVLLASGDYANAENGVSNPILSERWRFEIGGFSQDADLKISAGPVGEVADIVDLDQLGVDEDDDTLWLSGRLRVNDRWHIGLDYMEVDRAGFATSSRDFSFGEPPNEVDVTLGSSVTSELNAKYYILQAGYSFVSTERVSLGIGAGFHVIDFSASIAAELSSAGMTTDLGTGTSDITAPLPNVYFFGDFALSPKLAATATAGWFGLEVDRYDGELVSATASVEYRPWDNLGVGIGYTLVNVDASVDETDSLIQFEVDASGPRLYVVAGFGSVH